MFLTMLQQTVYCSEFIVYVSGRILVLTFGFALFMLSSKSASVVLSTVVVSLVAVLSSVPTDRPGIETARMTRLAAIAGGSYEAERCIAWQRAANNLKMSILTKFYLVHSFYFKIHLYLCQLFVIKHLLTSYVF